MFASRYLHLIRFFILQEKRSKEPLKILHTSEANGINLTEDKIASIDSLYPYMLCIKVLLLLWDTIGLIVNGLGIDLMWHGIEINHAVYSLVLQDIVLCWLSSFLWCMLNWIWWSTSGMFWCLQTLNTTVKSKSFLLFNLYWLFMFQISSGFKFTSFFHFCH